jgi:signal transduction histidine kinase
MIAELESDLMLALVHQGTYAPSFVPTPLPSLLDRVADGQQTYAEVKGVRLVVEAAAPGVLAEADARLLEEVLRNFVNNAIKFSPPGGVVKLHLQVTEEARAEIRVSDEGPGLTPADLERAFRPLARLSAEPTAGESSTGLGLSLAEEMVRLHGGRVWVDAPEGRGATFGLDLPLLARRAAAG